MSQVIEVLSSDEDTDIQFIAWKKPAASKQKANFPANVTPASTRPQGTVLNSQPPTGREATTKRKFMAKDYLLQPKAEPTSAVTVGASNKRKLSPQIVGGNPRPHKQLALEPQAVVIDLTLDENDGVESDSTAVAAAQWTPPDHLKATFSPGLQDLDVFELKAEPLEPHDNTIRANEPVTELRPPSPPYESPHAQSTEVTGSDSADEFDYAQFDFPFLSRHLIHHDSGIAERSSTEPAEVDDRLTAAISSLAIDTPPVTEGQLTSHVLCETISADYISMAKAVRRNSDFHWCLHNHASDSPGPRIHLLHFEEQDTVELGGESSRKQPHDRRAVKTRSVPSGRVRGRNDFGVGLKLQGEFRMGGATTCITQSEAGMAAAAAPKGGHHNYTFPIIPEPCPYNQPNNLGFMTREHTEVCFLNQHRGIWADVEKFYTLNDVTFDPFNASQAISAGEDGRLRRWEIGESIECMQTVQFHRTRPMIVQFHPQMQQYAVGCSDGTLQYSQSQIGSPFQKLIVAPRAGGLTMGWISWGSGLYAHLLFACVERDQNRDLTSPPQNVYFDTLTGQRFSLTKEGEYGEGLSMSSGGHLLGIATEKIVDDCTKFWMHLIDLRSGTRPVYSRKFTEAAKMGEVTTMAFSPDDTYLAVGRDDNILDVWDLRYQDTEPFRRFRHPERDALAGEPSGICRHLHWVDSQHQFGTTFGLVSGGGDGCVRLWDMQRAFSSTDDSHVLAECQYDIGALSVGEPGTGQWRLVVGDNGGLVKMYD